MPNLQEFLTYVEYWLITSNFLYYEIFFKGSSFSFSAISRSIFGVERHVTPLFHLFFRVESENDTFSAVSRIVEKLVHP